MPRKQNKKNKRTSPNVIAIIGAFIMIIGGFFLFYNYIQSKKIMAYDYMANVFYEENKKDAEEISEPKEENEGEPTEEVTSEKEVTNDYIGYLSIPKINFKKGFYDQKSPDNNVEKNIMVVEGSSYPDVEKGNLIIAGHSGTGWRAFFNDLYQLEVGDTATIDYNNKVYTYKIVSIYKQEKVGTIAIYRDYQKTTLTLVTCTNNDSNSQTIYVAELDKVE